VEALDFDEIFNQKEDKAGAEGQKSASIATAECS